MTAGPLITPMVIPAEIARLKARITALEHEQAKLTEDNMVHKAQIYRMARLLSLHLGCSPEAVDEILAEQMLAMLGKEEGNDGKDG